MSIKSFKRVLFYVLVMGISISLLFFVIICSWLGNEVKSQCQKARMAYSGDCVEALVKLLDDEKIAYRARNDAIWALGQLGDRRALPTLKSYYTGNIPPKEPLDKSISQYELSKAIDLTSGGQNLLAWTWRGRLAGGNPIPRREIDTETVVLSEKTDPYYSLAQMIAKEENLKMMEGIEDLVKITPRYILLVSSPEKLTPERLLEIGHYFQNQNYYPGLGIISGSTIEKAEQLWARKDLAKGGNNYLGGDVDVLQRIDEPSIYDISAPSSGRTELTKENLINTLRQADYFYWARHTGPRDWSWNEDSGNWTENDRLLASDIPELKPAVIYSLTCSPFRPWVENSIAMGFVDHGAAAYLGFVNTPHTASFLRDHLSVPGITSWSEFPLGLAAQIHNKVAAKTVFNSPQLFMLGDPRTYLSKDQPYQISLDRVANDGKRIIAGASDVNGILAVKINDGADYGYVSVKGLTSVSDSDFFYNNKLQFMNLGADKYLLFLHHGGSFEIELLPKAPAGWRVADALWDIFDYSWAVLWLSTYADGNPSIYLISLPIFMGILLYRKIRQKKLIKEDAKIFLIAFLYASIRLAYFLMRLNEYTVSANLVNYTPLQMAVGWLGVFASVAGGLIIMCDSTKAGIQLLGLLFAVLRQFWMAGFYFVFITLLNIVTPITRNTEPWLLSYDTFWLAFIPLLFESIAIFVIYRYVITNQKRKVQFDPASAVICGKSIGRTTNT